MSNNTMTGIITQVDRIWLLPYCKKVLAKRSKETVLLDKLDKCIQLLFQNPRHPSLNIETLFRVGNYQVMSSRLSDGCRVIFVPLTKTEIGLLNFSADHDGLYNWVQQTRSKIGTMLGKDEEIIRGIPVDAYIGTTSAIAYDENSPIAIASAKQFRKMLDEGLAKYLIHLDKEQQALVNLNVRSLLLVKGGAGTGKTAVAVHRLLALSRQTTLAATSPQDVLYLCFNKLLSKVTEQLIETLCNGAVPEWVRVNTFHTWCYEFLKETVGAIPILDERGCQQAVYRAMGKLSPEQKGALNKRDGAFVNDEIEQVIKQNGIRTLEEYLQFERRGLGQGATLKQPARKVIWEVYACAEAYQKQKNICRYCDLPLLALQQLNTMDNPPQYRAVIIDEGQDCSPVLIRLARRLIAGSAGHLTVFADPAQAIYECGFQWTQSELKPSGGNVRWLRKTYRTTRQIYDLAGCLLEDSDELREDLEQMLPPERFGPIPQFLIETSKRAVLEGIVEQIVQVAATRPANQIGVLAAKWDTLKDVEQMLVRRGIPTDLAERRAIQLGEPTVKLLSMHSVKGLDFPCIFLIGPRSHDLGGVANATLPETRHILYVALTRASEHLTVGVTAGTHHPLLEKLDDSYYEGTGTEARNFINGRGISFNEDGALTVR